MCQRYLILVSKISNIHSGKRYLWYKYRYLWHKYRYLRYQYFLNELRTKQASHIFKASIDIFDTSIDIFENYSTITENILFYVVIRTNFEKYKNVTTCTFLRPAVTNPIRRKSPSLKHTSKYCSNAWYQVGRPNGGGLQ